MATFYAWRQQLAKGARVLSPRLQTHGLHRFGNEARIWGSVFSFDFLRNAATNKIWVFELWGSSIILYNSRTIYESSCNSSRELFMKKVGLTKTWKMNYYPIFYSIGFDSDIYVCPKISVTTCTDCIWSSSTLKQEDILRELLQNPCRSIVILSQATFSWCVFCLGHCCLLGVLLV